MNEKNDDSKGLFAGYYLVAFFDLLGQQSELRQMHTLPNPADETEVDEFTTRVKQTYGAVKGMRTSFRSFFNAFTKSYADTYQLDPAQRIIFDQCQNNDIKIQQFSDCIAIFMPLRDDINKQPIRGVFGVLAAAATTFLSCMAYGQPISGGIDIGLALEIDNDEVYGPALSRAYNLESTVAQYPRVVIGEELIKYLNFHSTQKEKDIFSTVSRESAKACLKLLAIDDDGYPFIDYLGEYFNESMDETYNVEIITRAYQHIISESEKHKGNKNPKLAFKYTLLRNYFEDRMPAWEESLK